ncbi:histone H1 KNAG_0J01460 [Huiozyma naganishii CBS 8797]|uniref:Histone H1 n=1 Tax=Huiozyma naganishii (strain ATCC MYA-139 / BCRC 22969 / CBS 8797 / KCTC 17520 / NBRC 10181 / NCYC 3082 / Yp74L-3) TaxID=1071383 RepID=J7S2T3_HUIN7|nr:hypothetical protein KNAG_0J01460 [Kazachstania naganishii CBS 8797]CCK72227.1 hypothetical protein KNAG_0J01460 [Kazachstania naganishii CBS 8797]
MAPRKTAAKKAKVAKKPAGTKAAKGTTPAAVKGKRAQPSPNKTYKELISEALKTLKSRKGVSRPALKKYIKEHNASMAKISTFDHYLNQAIKRGVDSGDFELPRGPSGTVRLVAKPKAPASATPAAKKVVKAKKPATVSTAAAAAAASKKKTAKKVVKAKKTAASAPASSSLAPTYREMIIKSVVSMNEGKGSSRTALKKHILDEYFAKSKEIKNFNSLFNNAVKKAVEDGYLSQPKGPAGVIKVLKKGKSFATGA